MATFVVVFLVFEEFSRKDLRVAGLQSDTSAHREQKEKTTSHIVLAGISRDSKKG